MRNLEMIIDAVELRNLWLSVPDLAKKLQIRARMLELRNMRVNEETANSVSFDRTRKRAALQSHSLHNGLQPIVNSSGTDASSAGRCHTFRRRRRKSTEASTSIPKCQQARLARTKDHSGDNELTKCNENGVHGDIFNTQYENKEICENTKDDLLSFDSSLVVGRQELPTEHPTEDMTSTSFDFSADYSYSGLNFEMNDSCTAECEDGTSFLGPCSGKQQGHSEVDTADQPYGSSKEVNPLESRYAINPQSDTAVICNEDNNVNTTNSLSESLLNLSCNSNGRSESRFTAMSFGTAFSVSASAHSTPKPCRQWVRPSSSSKAIRLKLNADVPSSACNTGGTQNECAAHSAIEYCHNQSLSDKDISLGKTQDTPIKELFPLSGDNWFYSKQNKDKFQTIRERFESPQRKGNSGCEDNATVRKHSESKSVKVKRIKNSVQNCEATSMDDEYEYEEEEEGVDVEAITDENTLIELLDETEDISERKRIRERLKQIQFEQRAKQHEMLKRREQEREQAIKTRLQQAEEQKKRTLAMYDSMAKSAPAGGRKIMDVNIYKNADGTPSSGMSTPTSGPMQKRDLVEDAIRQRQQECEDRKKRILAAYECAAKSGSAGAPKMVNFEAFKRANVTDFTPQKPVGSCTFGMSGGVPKVVKAEVPSTPSVQPSGAPNFPQNDIDPVERAIRARLQEAEERKRRTLAAYDIIAKTGGSGPKVVCLEEFRDLQVSETTKLGTTYSPTSCFRGGVPQVATDQFVGDGSMPEAPRQMSAREKFKQIDAAVMQQQQKNRPK